MKKTIAILLTIMVLIGLAACTTPAAGTSAPAAAATVQPTATAEATATVAETTAAPTEVATAKDYQQIGADLMKTEAIGVTKLGMTKSEVLAKLGQPDSETKAEVWGADGLKHSDWTYSKIGLTINMVESTNAESGYTTYSITAKAPFAEATQKGVKIGDTKDAVLAAYGDAIENQTDDGTKNRIVAGSEFGGLLFGMKDGKVESIFLGAAAE